MTRLSRSDVRGRAQTVLGIVDPGELGPTLMHEHILWDIRTPFMATQADQGPEITLCNCWKINYGQQKAPRNYAFHDRSTATGEIAQMREAGGRAIVELTCGGMRPDPDGLAEISGATGVHIIMGCGHYVEEYQDRRNETRCADEFAAEMMAQVLEGAWGTDVRAGIIGEIGCQAPWTDLEKRVMLGAILAQAETGATINVHPGRHADQPQEVADFIATHKGVIERVVISHLDRTIFEEEPLLRLADTGVGVEFDLFGKEQAYDALADIDMPNDATRLRLIRTLINHGHIERIVISHDICKRTRLAAFGGHGYGHIFTNVVPMMRRRGFSDDEIDAILVRNPRRLLTFV